MERPLGSSRSCGGRVTTERLRTMAFTRALPEAERELLLDMVRQRAAQRNQIIFREGQKADSMFLIASGMVRLYVTRPDGRHVRAYLSAGDFFGHESTLAGERWRLSAEAVGAVSAPGGEGRTSANTDHTQSRAPRVDAAHGHPAS